jgi:hypothetical protein
MTNEQKAARLEEMAQYYLRIGDKDAALLRQAAQLMRERCDPEWSVLLEREYKDRMLSIAQARSGVAYWYVDAFPDYESKVADSLDAAKAAAIAWVDGLEGK